MSIKALSSVHSAMHPQTTKAVPLSQFQNGISMQLSLDGRMRNKNVAIPGGSIIPAIYRDVEPTYPIHSDIPGQQPPSMRFKHNFSQNMAAPMHTAGRRPLDSSQAEGLAGFFHATQHEYFLQESVPRSLGWPQYTRDLSVSEVLEKFSAENLQQLVAYRKAGMTGRKSDGTPIKGFVGDIDHLLAYLNVVNDNSAVKAAQILRTNIFMNAPTPGYESYRVGEVMKLFDITDVNDLSNIHNDYVLGMHPLGGTVLGGEMFDTPQLRKSLEDLQKKTAQWAEQLPQALRNMGDDRNADIARRAQKMRGPFND